MANLHPSEWAIPFQDTWIAASHTRFPEEEYPAFAELIDHSSAERSTIRDDERMPTKRVRSAAPFAGACTVARLAGWHTLPDGWTTSTVPCAPPVRVDIDAHVQQPHHAAAFTFLRQTKASVAGLRVLRAIA